MSDTFRIGGTVAKFTRSGWGTYAVTGEANADKDITAARLSMEWEPSDNLFVRVFGDYSIDDSTSRQGHRLLPVAPRSLQPSLDEGQIRPPIGKAGAGRWLGSGQFSELHPFRFGDFIASSSGGHCC